MFPTAVNVYLENNMFQLSEEREVKSVINHVNSSVSQTARSTPSPSHSVVNLDEHGAFNRIDSYHGISSNRKAFQVSVFVLILF